MPRPLPILRGRVFGCTSCGQCCEQDGFVFLERGELGRLAQHLGLTAKAFRHRFGVFRHPETRGWALAAKDGRGCPLLNAERLCSVHAVKPAQCASFPFWPDLLKDRSAWEAAKSYCPGLDAPEGRRYTRSEIRAVRDGLQKT